MPNNDNSDPIWKYAKRIFRNKFKCIFCDEDFQGGPEKIKCHLSGIGGKNIGACKELSSSGKVTYDVWDEACSALFLYLGQKYGKLPNVVSKKRKAEASSSRPDGDSSYISNPTISSDEVANSLAKLVEMGGINYKVVESSYFTDFVTALTKSGPACTLPSSSELRSKLIPSFKTKVEEYAKSAIQSWRKTGCTLESIFWVNEKQGKSFLSIFGCSRDWTVLLKTVEVPTDKDRVEVPTDKDQIEVPTDKDQVASALDEAFHSVVQLVGSANIVQCIADASEYGERFLTFFANNFPHVYRSYCAAHLVRLLFEEIFQGVDWIQATFRKIKSIVDYICSDTSILELMRKYTNGKELKQPPLGLDCLSSYYKMLESILDAKEKLVQLVRSPEWHAYDKGLRGSEVTKYIEDSSTWELGEIIRLDLCLVDFHDSSGYLYGFMEIVKDTISQLCYSNPDKYQSLWGNYNSKWMQIFSYFHFGSAFLNPAYMRTEKAKAVNWDKVTEHLATLHIALDRQEAFKDEVAKYRKMLSSNRYEIAEFNLPCQWWENCGQELPTLRDLAIRYLSQPVSTSTCKSSMCTVEALLAKEQSGSPQGIIDLHFKVNAFLMESVNKNKIDAREKIVLAEFNKHISHYGSRPLRQLKLRFLTMIAPSIRTRQNVEGEKGHRIHVCLEDPSTGRVVQDGIPSTLPLTISVLDGDFSNEASSDGHTREYFNRNDLSAQCPYLSGDLQVTLKQGEGMLGNFSFIYSSANQQSGQFKLAVKTQTGVCGEFRILEGISNSFTVEDAQAEVSPEHPMSLVDRQSGPFSGNPSQGEWLFGNVSSIQNGVISCSAGIGDANINYSSSGTDQTLAPRRVRKKALPWKLRSRGRGVTLKRGSQAYRTKRRGKEVPELRRAVYSSGSNNVNQQEDGEEVNSEPVELEGIDSLSSTSARTLFGIASLSGAKPVGETNEIALPTHQSTALQLSLKGDGVLEPRQEAGEPRALKGIDSISSTSVIARGSTPLKPESPAIMLFGVQVAGGTTWETHDGHSLTARAMPTTEDSKEITYIGVRKRSLGRYDAEIQDPGKKSRVLVGTFDTAAEAAIAYDAVARQFLGPYTKTNFPITSKPDINSKERGNQMAMRSLWKTDRYAAELGS